MGNKSIQVSRLYRKGYSEGRAGMRDPTGLVRHPGTSDSPPAEGMTGGNSATGAQ